MNCWDRVIIWGEIGAYLWAGFVSKIERNILRGGDHSKINLAGGRRVIYPIAKV